MRTRQTAVMNPRTKTRVAIALVIAVAMVLLASSALVGCGRRSRQVTRDETPSVVTTQAPSESTSTGTDQTSPSERMNAAKAKALDAQLNKIDSELNGVQMPEDSTFNDSAGALR